MYRLTLSIFALHVVGNALCTPVPAFAAVPGDHTQHQHAHHESQTPCKGDHCFTSHSADSAPRTDTDAPLIAFISTEPSFEWTDPMTDTPLTEEELSTTGPPGSSVVLRQ